MTFAELRERARALCWPAGWSEIQPAPNWAMLVREGHRLFFWEAQVLTSDQTLTTATGQAEYVLTTPPDWVLVTDVLYGATDSLQQVTEAALRRHDPLWTKAANARPVYWWMSEPNTIRLYPAPATSGDTIYVHGVRLDTDLVADSDTPSCPAVFHEGIALFAAWHHGKLYARGEDRAILEVYLEEARAYVARCQEYFASQDTAAFVRRVKRAPVDYVHVSLA